MSLQLSLPVAECSRRVAALVSDVSTLGTSVGGGGGGGG
jgi:hypothetical protein